MSALGLDLPDFSGHPKSPKLTFDQYQKWVCEEIVPELVRQGKMSPEINRADFKRNEGRQIEPWPDFGNVSWPTAPAE